MKKFKLIIIKLINKFLCWKNGHIFNFVELPNKIRIYTCDRCKIISDNLAEDNYDTKCLINNKIRKLPLIKDNFYTIWVGIDNKIIKRHKTKHDVCFI